MALRSDRPGGQTHDEDLDLARRCERGDEDAQRSFVDRLGSLVYSVCGRGGIEGPDRDDVAQQILLDAFSALPCYQGASRLSIVRNAWTLLASILESAVEYGYLPTNPARGVKFPLKPVKQKPAIIAGEDFVKLLRHLGEPHRTMVRMIAATGLRIGELLALRWSSLDLEAGTLAVRESVFEGQFQVPKTKRAQRTIPLGPRAVKVLTQHRDRSSRTEPGDLVFINRKGQPFRESKLLTRVLQPAAVEAGLGRLTWHQFRHIHSSLMSDLKVPVKIAQEQLGHASIATTLNIYTHVVDASHRSAVEAVEERLFVDLDSNGLELAKALESAAPASDSVN